MKNERLLNYFSQQVNLFFDNRLGEESRQNLLDAVQNDSDISKVFETERQYRDFIKTKAKRPCPSEDLIKSIKSKLG